MDGIWFNYLFTWDLKNLPQFSDRFGMLSKVYYSVIFPALFCLHDNGKSFDKLCSCPYEEKEHSTLGIQTTLYNINFLYGYKKIT